MNGFKLTAPGGVTIRFAYYQDAPATAAAFESLLPFSKLFLHARYSGEEIWTDDALPLYVIQENASVFTMPGEVVYGPANAKRAQTANCMGIYYGKGKGLDCCNIFACVFEDDRELLAQLGQAIWKKGEQLLTFTKL